MHAIHSHFYQVIPKLTQERRKNLILNCPKQDRVVIEHACDLKNSWRQLLHVKVEVKRAVKIIITSCCVLHNFLIIQKEKITVYREVPVDEEEDHGDLLDAGGTGKSKRDELVNLVGL